MKASKVTEAQIAFILTQAEDDVPVLEVCRKAGISDATFYNWRKKYAGLMPSEMKRLRQLEDEKAKLKRIVADLSMDKAMLPDFLLKKALTPGRKRELVDKLRSDWKVSIRRVCSALRVDRSLYVYKSKRGSQADIKQRIKEIAQTRVRYGYRAFTCRCDGGGQGGERQADLSALQGSRPVIAAQDPEEAGQSQTAGRSGACRAAQRNLGDGFCSRPAGDGPQDPHADDCRHLQLVLACGRPSLQLSGRRRGLDARADLQERCLSKDDPGRSGFRVRLARF